MSYTKTTWVNGDKITAEKLNNLENGVEAASEAELPASTAEDAGKVLTVGSTGAAEWDEAPIYDCIIDTDQTDYSQHLRGSYADLSAALVNGNIIRILEYEGEELISAVLMSTANFMSIATQVVLYFSCVIKDNNSVMLIQNDFTIAANGDVTKDIITATLTAS